MTETILTWKDEYLVGVSFIDKAHRELFEVIYRFNELIGIKSEESRKSLCASMIRYLVKYTTKHFSEEEGYMRKISYSGYETHKCLHDNLKNNTVPHLIDMLEEQNYSDDALKRFIAVLSAWLASHIVIEDQAITKDVATRWNDGNDKDLISLIDSEFKLFVEDLFGIKITLINRHYEGEYLGENTYSFYNTVKWKEKTFKTLFLCDGEFIEHVVKHVSDAACYEVSSIALEAFGMIVSSWSKAAVGLITGSKDVVVIDGSSAKNMEYSQFFKDTLPQQSLVWKSDNYQMGMAIKV